MPGTVICEQNGEYHFIDANSNTAMKVRGDKLISLGDVRSGGPRRYEVQRDGATVAQIVSHSWRFEEPRRTGLPKVQ